METDSKRLMMGLTSAVAQSPFNIASERSSELIHDIMGGRAWEVLFNENARTNVEALLQSKMVHVPFAALSSLWAVAAAAYLLADAGIAASRQGVSALSLAPDTGPAIAMDLRQQARKLISNQFEPWAEGLPEPAAAPPRGSVNECINNLFLGAFGFITLHEIAHIALQHKRYTTQMHEQEKEADLWASGWILKAPPSNAQREFRVFSIAVALCWIGLIDEVRRSGTTHPHASARLWDIYQTLSLPQQSPSLEMAAYVTKALFDPYTPIAAVDYAYEAFQNVLVSYSRQLR